MHLINHWKKESEAKEKANVKLKVFRSITCRQEGVGEGRDKVWTSRGKTRAETETKCQRRRKNSPNPKGDNEDVGVQF